jgi:hypothetical protein
VLLFSLLAAARVFIFSAAFPFFSNVDEAAHFDLVLKYSHGHIPDSLEFHSKETARFYARTSTIEYNIESWEGYQPVRYENAGPEERRRFNEEISRVSATINYESSQAPLYYAIAGIWKSAGTVFGIEGLALQYWIRFLNVVFIMALVWLAYLIALEAFPGQLFIKISVPLLVAFMPQDTYYAIQNDVLSPLCFAFTVLYLNRFAGTGFLLYKKGAIAGITLAATVLVKVSNIPLLLVVSGFFLVKLHRSSRSGDTRPVLRSVLLFFICALTPIILWFAWNYFSHGDVTGSEGKIRSMGWSHKSFSEWFSHPLFTPGGLSRFWEHLMFTFWRGELIWFGKPLASPYMDTFYWFSSFAFLGITMFVVQRKLPVAQKQLNLFYFLSFISLVIFMALLSVSLDFGDCPYPSKAHPFFTSGRLITAALVPFVMLYVQALNWLFAWIRSENLRVIVTVLIVTVITWSEIMVTIPAFSSNFNWYHLH